MCDWLRATNDALSALPPTGQLMLYGLVGGAVGMIVYRYVSPQRRLTALKQQVSAARTELRRYDGDDPRTLLRLAGRAISLGLRQLLLVLLPTAVAILPMLLLMTCVGRTFPPADRWWRSWEWPFMGGATVAALILKWTLRIA